MRALVFQLVFLITIGAPRAGTIGFQLLTIPDPGSKPLSVAVWYPSESAAISQTIGPFLQAGRASVLHTENAIRPDIFI